MPRIYLDSCVVIYCIEGTKEIQESIRGRLHVGSTIKNMVCVSDLVRMECRVAPLKKNDSALLEDYNRFFSLPDIIKLELGTSVFDLATELRAQKGLKTPDALHAASAIIGGCEQFWTNDRRLAALEPQIRIVVLP